MSTRVKHACSTGPVLEKLDNPVPVSRHDAVCDHRAGLRERLRLARLGEGERLAGPGEGERRRSGDGERRRAGDGERRRAGEGERRRAGDGERRGGGLRLRALARS